MARSSEIGGRGSHDGLVCKTASPEAPIESGERRKERGALIAQSHLRLSVPS